MIKILMGGNSSTPLCCSVLDDVLEAMNNSIDLLQSLDAVAFDNENSVDS
jgi:hypothetical protein